MAQTLAGVPRPISQSTDGEAILTRIGFRTRNLSLAEYQSLTEQERETFHELAWEENHAWLTSQLQKHGAAWLMVVDGQIIASSSDLDEYPTESEIMDNIEETGKFPFIFIDNAILSIEEGASEWHRTVYADDFYPTLGIDLLNSNQTVTLGLTADFDTGAHSMFADLDRLTGSRVIELTLADIPRVGTHLNQQYSFVLKKISLRIAGLPEPQHLISKTVICVRDWPDSPFVRINPTREALTGRDIPRKVGVAVTLDFANHTTSVRFPETT